MKIVSFCLLWAFAAQDMEVFHAEKVRGVHMSQGSFMLGAST